MLSFAPRVFLLLCTATLASSFMCPVAPCKLPSRRPAALDIQLKKGRAQGGGPKIALRRKKSKTEGQLSSDKRIAEMRRREMTRKKRPIIMYGRQGQRFKEHVKEGSVQHPVYARQYAEGANENEWLCVGHVTIAKDVAATTTAADAARFQKRLILEHGCRVHRQLQLQRELLECGLGSPEDTGAEAFSEEGAVTDVVPIEGGAAPTDEAAAYSNAATCGFSGLPIPDAGHYYSSAETERVARDQRNVNLVNAFGKAAKSATAVQESKTLGLRSLG